MATRYHPGVIWGPFLLALALGLAVSAGLYFAYLWPQVEPDDEALDAGGATASTAAPATAANHDSSTAKSAEAAADNKADDAKAADSAGPGESEAETEAAAPTSESSPA